MNKITKFIILIFLMIIMNLISHYAILYFVPNSFSGGIISYLVITFPFSFLPLLFILKSFSIKKYKLLLSVLFIILFGILIIFTHESYIDGPQTYVIS